jgi:excinuclease ABC subunit C
LDGIPGVGDKRKRALFDAFMTLDAIKAAVPDDLKAVPLIDARTAEAVYQYFHKDEPAETANLPSPVDEI